MTGDLLIVIADVSGKGVSAAIIMSSGKGALSRIYKTTDACATWILLFTNPDPEGFWDAVVLYVCILILREITAYRRKRKATK